MIRLVSRSTIKSSAKSLELRLESTFSCDAIVNGLREQLEIEYQHPFLRHVPYFNFATGRQCEQMVFGLPLPLTVNALDNNFALRILRELDEVYLDNPWWLPLITSVGSFFVYGFADGFANPLFALFSWIGRIERW